MKHLSATFLGWAAAMGLGLGQAAYAQGDQNEPSPNQSEYGDTGTVDENTQSQQSPGETQPGMESEPGAEQDQFDTEQAQQNQQQRQQNQQQRQQNQQQRQQDQQRNQQQNQQEAQQKTQQGKKQGKQMKRSQAAVNQNQRDVISFRQMSKAEKRDMQQALKSENLYQAELDGIVGPKTLTALRSYQKQNQLPVTGKLDVATAESLGLGLLVETQPVAGTRAGSGQLDKGTIEDAQSQLQQLNLYTGQIDGIVGPKTRSAVRKYQQQNNLQASGRLDQETLSQLGVQSDTQTMGDELDEAGEQLEELGDEAEDTADDMSEEFEQQPQQNQQQQNQQQQNQQQQNQQQQDQPIQEEGDMQQQDEDY